MKRRPTNLLDEFICTTIATVHRLQWTGTLAVLMEPTARYLWRTKLYPGDQPWGEEQAIHFSSNDSIKMICSNGENCCRSSAQSSLRIKWSTFEAFKATLLWNLGSVLLFPVQPIRRDTTDEMNCFSFAKATVVVVLNGVVHAVQRSRRLFMLSVTNRYTVNQG